MGYYRVVYEIEVDAGSPLEAAKLVQDIFDDPDHLKGIFFVQEENEKVVYSIDLEEADEYMEQFVENYEPLIHY